jgi:hypothetical protein
MIELVENDKIGIILAKDMSRIGRNYLEVGIYTEMLFSEHNVRFIAVNSGVDSANQQDNDFTPFLNIINEFYVKDSSKKVKASMSQDWRKDPVPFPSYLLTNNNANIRRVRQRIEELSNRSEFVGWTFPGGEAKVNEAENRLQLIFEDKPDADTRQALKSEGFKWAPSQGAWQRQLNQNAIRAAARLDFLRPEDGKSPYQLQPFAKRAGKDVSR